MALLPRRSISRWMRRISNSSNSLSGAPPPDRYSIFSESRAPTSKPAGGPMSCLSGECARTSRVLYLCAWLFRKPICHWIVGDPVTLLRTSTQERARAGYLRVALRVAGSLFTRLGRWVTNGALICNGRELARAYASPRTIEIVSSTVKESDFFPRVDTCQGPVVRILFVGFLRPEKGIEYLLDAVAQLKADVPWELEIVGPREFPEYCEKLDEIAAARGIRERIRWTGYVPNGKPLFDRMRAADLFVLPTLSEGTPHVLVEARASGLPCISTTVGGVPTTVTDGYDALLVPPKDARGFGARHGTRDRRRRIAPRPDPQRIGCRARNANDWSTVYQPLCV